MTSRMLVGSAVAAVTAFASASSAAVISFTSLTLWSSYSVANGQVVITESFDSIADGSYASPFSSSVGGINWTATATGGLFVNGGQFSTNDPSTLTFSMSPGVQGIGGNLYGTDINFNVVPSIIQLSLQDGTSYIAFIDSQTAFAGFYSTGAAISAITISAQPLPGGTNAVYPTFDNMSVAVPAPGAIALLGLAGLAGRRRR